MTVFRTYSSLRTLLHFLYDIELAHANFLALHFGLLVLALITA
jgi:hypothetical protein